MGDCRYRIYIREEELYTENKTEPYSPINDSILITSSIIYVNSSVVWLPIFTYFLVTINSFPIYFIEIVFISIICQYFAWQYRMKLLNLSGMLFRLSRHLLISDRNWSTSSDLSWGSVSYNTTCKFSSRSGSVRVITRNFWSFLILEYFGFKSNLNLITQVQVSLRIIFFIRNVIRF